MPAQVRKEATNEQSNNFRNGKRRTAAPADPVDSAGVFLLGTVGSAVGVSVLCGPSQLISQMHRHDAGQKVYDSLNTRFQNDYNTTAVPAEVYMDTISVDWLEQCMENKVTALYGKGSGDIDFSALESSITDYFEKYAEENNCAKDDTYNEKLRETIDNGEKVISDATDLLRTETTPEIGLSVQAA